MKKEKLRKVEYESAGTDLILQGYFHRWVFLGNRDNIRDCETCAIVEDMKGKCHYIDMEAITFID